MRGSHHAPIGVSASKGEIKAIREPIVPTLFELASLDRVAAKEVSAALALLTSLRPARDVVQALPDYTFAQACMPLS